MTEPIQPSESIPPVGLTLQPSRDDGFSIMDISTSIHADPKFRRLCRLHPDLLAPAFMVYVSVLAESWRAGRRVTLDDAWPLLLPYDQAVADALKVQLLDHEGRIPERAWRAWYGPASERREARRASGRIGGRRSGASRREASLQHRSNDAEPYRPTYRPTVRPSVPAPARDGNADDASPTTEPWSTSWSGFLKAWNSRFGLPPTEEQRAVLWEIVDARPDDAAAWLDEAPADCSTFDAVAHVLERWREFRDAIQPEPPPQRRAEASAEWTAVGEMLHAVTPGIPAQKDGLSSASGPAAGNEIEGGQP